MLYSPIKFRLTVVKPYNYDPDRDTNPSADNPEDIVYTKGPARPGRLEVRIPAIAAPLAAIIPTAKISSIILTVATLSIISTIAILLIPTAAIYPSPATRPNQARQLSLSPVRVVSNVIINKD